ncbi:hypothetical protein BB561_002581 [Smittium simulii]|uniref:Transmembrane protein 198 n=1 Tax=Smittium simulii TaxID=133385 RepID=A0A2T9YPZ7_9FUNG|nr:hypothetical protein BB561_002581 [Smittium simulii]
MLQKQLLLCLFSLAAALAQTDDTKIKFNENGSIEASGAVAGAVLIVVGLLFTFFGRKLIKVIIFLSGWAFVAALSLTVMYKVRAPTDTEEKRALIYLICSMALGLIGGIVAVALYKVGLFLVGALGGFAIGSYILTWSSVGIFKEKWAQITFVCVLALLAGIIILVIEKPVVIMLTSLQGSYSFFVGVDCFTKTGFKDAMVSVFSDLNRIDDINKKIYIMLGGTALFALIGIIVQFSTNRSPPRK